MKILIVILIMVAVTAVLILKGKQPRATAQPISGSPLPSEDFPPKPRWKPGIPIDLDRVAKAFRYYSDNKMTFAVFENGTCVPVRPESEQREQDALAVLDQLFHRHPDFNPLLMDDGNWMISHSDAAYSICFADEVESNWETIWTPWPGTRFSLIQNRSQIRRDVVDKHELFRSWRQKVFRKEKYNKQERDQENCERCNQGYGKSSNSIVNNVPSESTSAEYAGKIGDLALEGQTFNATIAVGVLKNL
jgi:hypothetical protein